MAEDKPNLEASEENRPSPIDPNEAAEAVKEVKEAMAILPKKRLGCLGLLTKYAILLLGLLTLFVYWNFLRTPRLKISKETSHITEPRTSDGARVDYFAALEQELCPPELKTDDNGYRLIVRALGDVPENLQEKRGKSAIEARAAQVYERLGLDPAIEPTMTYSEYYGILREYCAAKGHDEKEVDKEVDELADKVLEPWTLDDLPMMAPWLEKNGPALDLVGEAVRRPAFFFPLVGPNEEATFGGDVAFVALGEMQRTRSFARMLLARANYRIGVGDIDGAINDVVTCERLGRHVESQGTILANLVGIAVRGMAASVGVAANRQSLPTKEQLQHLVEELDAIPLRPNTDRMWLADRYYTLHSLQAMAFGEGSLAALFSAWGAIEHYKPGIAARLPVDWNVIMRRVNGYYDNLYDNLDKDENQVLCPPKRLWLGNLFIGVRSRRMADLVISLYMPAMQASREANRRSKCVDNVRRITRAMLLYQCEHGTLPPAYTVDAAGNPLHSWRVLLLPYLGKAEVYGKLRLDEPWDSQHNRQFHDAAVPVYQCPSADLKPGQTAYSVVVGEKTAFQGGKGRSLDDFGRNLILVVEREQSLSSDGHRQGVCWMDPTSELVQSVAFQGINRRENEVEGIGSPHPGGLDVGFRDGSVWFIAQNTALPWWQGMLDGTAEQRP